VTNRRIVFPLLLAAWTCGADEIPVDWSGGNFVARPGVSRRLEAKVPTGCRGLRLVGGMKATAVEPGRERWHTGRLSATFVDASGCELGRPFPRQFECLGTTDWIDIDHTYLVPSNAVALRLGLHDLGRSGEVEFRPVRLSAVRGWATGPCDAPRPSEELWMCRPAFAGEAAGFVPRPGDCWGWAKVPSVWLNERKPFPPTTVLSPWVEDNDALQKSILPARAWYGRRLAVPEVAHRKDSRTVLRFGIVNTRAVVHVDGARVGEVVFPGGDVDISDAVRTKTEVFAAIDVTACPLTGETLNYNAPDRAEREKDAVMYKGLTGGLSFVVEPAGARIVDTAVAYDCASREATFRAETTNLVAGTYELEARVESLAGRAIRTFRGAVASASDGVLELRVRWPEAPLWDVHTPDNLCRCTLTLRRADGAAVDATKPFRCGFRDVRTRGRDLLLNGTPIHLRGLYCHMLGAVDERTARDTVREAFLRMRAEGFNAAVAGNYRFKEGTVTRVDRVLDVCDELGMLFVYALPHVRDFGFALDDPAVADRYRRLTRQAIALARRHPSVVLYALNHNCTGYGGDQNPLRMDGAHYLADDERDAIGYKPRNRLNARLSGAIVRALDPTRPLYHHESGTLDGWHTLNIYLNWSPRQERSDWIEHWSAHGVAPLFFVEWGLPDLGSWSSYRGPHFLWTTPVVFNTWAAEYAAAVLGDRAYEDSPEMRALIAREDREHASGRPFSFDIAGVRALTNLCAGVQAYFADDNWRSFRARGLTAAVPWGQGGFFRRVNLAAQGLEYWEGRGRRSDWEETVVGRSFRRWNRDVIAWIGGDDAVTDKRHHYRPGAAIAKRLVVVNDRRVRLDAGWRCALDGQVVSGRVDVGPGEVAQIPVSLAAPARAGTYALKAEFDIPGDGQSDEFPLEVVAPAVPPVKAVALLDVRGLTRRHFARLGVRSSSVTDPADVSAGTALVVGRESLDVDRHYGKLLDFARRGGSVLLFEQDAKTLSRLGFRVQEYGLRRAFHRFVEPGSDGLSDARLENWAGASTLVSPYFKDLPKLERSEPRTEWCGFRNTRVWRCGNRGAVATVLPEKPTCGDWRALADGGFDLQYAPLLEWRVGRGRMVFCQFDVTARTAADPFADDLSVRLVASVGGSAWRGVARPAPLLLKSGDRIPSDLEHRVRNGLTVLGCGLTAAEVRRVSPVELSVVETNGCCFTRIRRLPPELNGLSNADWAWHGAMSFAAFVDVAEDGNSAFRVVRYGQGRIVFMQVPPWKIDCAARPHLRTSRRRAEYALQRIKGNLGFGSEVETVSYADAPEADDDPYRYIRW